MLEVPIKEKKVKKGTVGFLMDQKIPLFKVNKRSFLLDHKNKSLTSLYKRKSKKGCFKGYFLDSVVFGVVYRHGVDLERLERNILSYINTQWPSTRIYTTVHTRAKHGHLLRLSGNPNNSIFKRLAQEHFVKCGMGKV